MELYGRPSSSSSSSSSMILRPLLPNAICGWIMEGGNDLPSLSLFNTPHSALSPYIVTPSHSPGDCDHRLGPMGEREGNRRISLSLRHGPLKWVRVERLSTSSPPPPPPKIHPPPLRCRNFPSLLPLVSYRWYAPESECGWTTRRRRATCSASTSRCPCPQCPRKPFLRYVREDALLLRPE